MKRLFRLKGALIVSCLLFSCNENRLLEERPLDFRNEGDSFVNMAHFESALTDLYARVRHIHYGRESVSRFSHFLATDVAKHARGDAGRFGDYAVWLVPTNHMVEDHWNGWYKLIANVNTIISRLENSELSPDEKILVSAEAKFFRGLAYRYLVYLYGGVPLITEEIRAPKTDFVRASREEVLHQIVEDLSDAAVQLPSIAQTVDGRVSNLVAWHYLAETYISLGRFDDAIAASSWVIDDPSTALMTSRFGSRSDITPGDVYWDLFQRENQNRGTGNVEALWVAQMEVDVIGGLLSSSSGTNNVLEKWAGPAAWLTLTDPDGQEGMLTLPFSSYETGGGGRGISFMMVTDYYINEIWESDFENDIRNAPHNLVRDFKYNNPNSAWKDSSIVKYPSPMWLNQNWRWYPYPSKITTPGDHPDQMFEDKSRLILKSTAGSTYSDQYFLRLAESYLLRAEAYFMNGQLEQSAMDINAVRRRANANDVTPVDVSLDYILDERARELIYEEQRRITLCRMGKLVERVRKYNDLNADDIRDFNNLWPIPYADIEANKDAVLEQNPGYN